MRGPLAAFVVLLGASGGATAELQSKYDRFRDQTELWAPSLDVTLATANKGKLTPQAFTNFKGHKPQSPPPTVAIAFRVVSKGDWQFLRCHGVDALLDGKAFPMPKSKHDGQALQGGGGLESVMVMLDWKDFSRLTTANRIEFRVCNSELTLTQKLIDDWRALVRAGSSPAM